MKAIYYALGAIVAVGAVAFLYWTISPFFITKTMHEAVPEGGAMSEMSVPVVDTPTHPASGDVFLITHEDGSQTIRYENYSTLNGPDLFVYLAKDLEASEFVSLGRVRATEGNVNYEVPEGVDVSEYPYVLTWCRAFGVLFNHANLTPLFEKDGGEEEFCIQVVTSARNPETGEFKEFPTPCDVPEGWEIIMPEGFELNLEVI